MTDKNKVFRAHVALTTYDVLLAIFEQIPSVPSTGSSTPLKYRDLKACALVSRAWAEPALCTLWSDLPSLFPLWHLLAPPDLPYPRVLSEPEPEYLQALVSAKLHEDPARWEQFLRYARRVHSLTAEHGRSTLQLDLARTVFDHNQGVSVFSSLKELYWISDSMFDVVAFSPLLLTPTLRSATLCSLGPMPGLHGVVLFNGFMNGGGPLTAAYGMLLRLARSSPHLNALHFRGAHQITSVSDAVRAQPSFGHLRTVSFTCPVSHSALLVFAAKPHLESIQASRIIPDKPPLSVASRPRTPTSSTLVHLDISGDWVSLRQLFDMLDAPTLQSAALNIDKLEELQSPDYVACTTAFAQAVSSATFTRLELSTSGRVPSRPGVADPIPFPSAAVLHAILEPLLALHNLRSFSLSSFAVLFRVNDDALERVARGWPRLVDFSIPVVLLGVRDGRPTRDLDGAVPTARALHHFWRYCPDLRTLVLPRLDLSCVTVKDLPPPPPEGSTHALAELRVLTGKYVANQPQGELPDDEAKALASYIHRLFPSLRLDDRHCQAPGIQNYGEPGVPVAWRKVFTYLHDL
ncbi:hypothetical protein LXA43DRAFT_890234 [Ganoderma leucocontextum]|nr:hypothetical protein LXA43DRAFT_890234 [Ganoderma leucocontextum]